MNESINYKVASLIGDEWVTGSEELPIYDPATANRLGSVSEISTDRVETAVAAATRAFESWSRLPPTDRAAWLRKIADALAKKAEYFAQLETLNTGKPIQVSRTIDIPRSINNLRFFADSVTQWASESHHSGGRILNYTLRDPLGVVACISPWNLPLYLFTWKIAPALAAGNTVIVKPSELTPLTAQAFGELLMEEGFPPGVLNILQGRGNTLGRAMVDNHKIKAVSFTGSTAVGREIAASTAKRLCKVSLELGGKNPMIVFDDAPLDKVLQHGLRAGYSNQGQICLCASRIFVQRGIWNRFVDSFVPLVESLVVGDPWSEKTQLGSLISPKHLDRVQSLVDEAKKSGAKILTGGTAIHIPGKNERGSFYRPTVLTDLPHDSLVNQMEIFGPVVALFPFDTEDEVVALSNETLYGLSASVWTSSLAKAHSVSARLECGMVWVNTWMHRDLRTPFGGVKASGLGREGGFEALRFFTESKNVCIDYNEF